MAKRSKIEWTDDTWNPIAGCTRESEGCRFCYAESFAARGLPGFEGLARFVERDGKREARWTGAIQVREHLMTRPLEWKKPRRIFVNSMSDLFHPSVPEAVIDRVFATMVLCPHHTFQILTKRPERMRKYLATAHCRVMELVCDMVVEEQRANVILIAEPEHKVAAPAGVHVHLWRWPLANVWIGGSVEDQVTFDVRIPYLLETPAAIRWVSAEPLLGLINYRRMRRRVQDLEFTLDALTGAWSCSTTFESFEEAAAGLNIPPLPPRLPGLDLIVCGGESGPNARPMHPDWARKTRDQCAAAGVPFFFKQWGEWLPEGQPTGKPIGKVDIYRRRWCNAEDGEDRYTRTAAAMHPVGKRRAGRLLDGVEHNGMPEVHHG